LQKTLMVDLIKQKQRRQPLLLLKEMFFCLLFA
jgi:hypothetical protein